MKIFIDEQNVENVIVSLNMPYVLKSIGKQPIYDYYSLINLSKLSKL